MGSGWIQLPGGDPRLWEKRNENESRHSGRAQEPGNLCWPVVMGTGSAGTVLLLHCVHTHTHTHTPKHACAHTHGYTHLHGHIHMLCHMCSTCTHVLKMHTCIQTCTLHAHTCTHTLHAHTPPVRTHTRTSHAHRHSVCTSHAHRHSHGLIDPLLTLPSCHRSPGPD